jgi:hypothetical protein
MSYRRRNLVNGGGAGFNPAGLSKVSAWLRNAATSGAVSTWESMLDANDASGPSGKEPVGGAGGLLTFATNDVMSWPLTAANNQTTKTGFACWIKQPSNILETIIRIGTGTLGANVQKLAFFINTSRRLRFDAYISGADGRSFATPINVIPAAGTAFWVRFAYDSAGATEADRVKIYINGVSAGVLTGSNLGAGGTIGTLPTATGNALIGNSNNGVAAQAFNGEMGPNFYCLSDDLTASEELNLMNFEPLA